MKVFIIITVLISIAVDVHSQEKTVAKRGLWELVSYDDDYNSDWERSDDSHHHQLATKVGKVVPVIIEKKVPVYVEKKIHVPVDRLVPVPYKVPVEVPVIQKEYVAVPKPYPVYVKKKVYVEKPVPVTVHIKHRKH
ncbi:uncharacterized protein LOC131678475 [Topomyia yanbarensis]|uniref:uncharacterized protein LOC131678475 n=1 Tax=Topomyia yanbarensis TaxID=2498891 RepID=UPI00273BC7EB|nr:uncharacterized protein LOC131678475 [Topomyia yanbarensis]